MEIATSIWEAISPVRQFLGAILLSLTTAGLLALFRPKVRIIWGSTSLSAHSFSVDPSQPPIGVATEKLYVQNYGKKPAKDVELVLNDRPSSYKLYTQREHVSKQLDDGSFIIRIPSLAPRELLIVDTVDIHLRGARLVAVNCPDTITKEVSFLPQRQFGRPMYALVLFLMVAGIVGTFYALLRLVFG
ncbi:MAG: hypothetical protein VX874_21955 [Pseudomonadota bacterium]|nr:hypothetical protein [Pseudomonadota bacterium]